MPITEATLKQARLYPELVPDAQFDNITVNTEISPLELRRISPLVGRLVNIGVERDDAVEVRVKSNVVPSLSGVNAGSLLNLEANRFDILTTDHIQLRLFSSAGETNYGYHYGLWLYEPTVAHKLKYGLKLTPEEQRINKDLGISKSVEKGMLPLPLSQQTEREYQVIAEETHAYMLNIGTAATTIESMVPAPGEFLVLTKLACDPGAAGDNIRLSLDRDSDSNYISDLRAYPLSLDRDLACFIPAVDELRLAVRAGGAVSDWNVRYTVLRVKMTNLIRCRFGLVTKDELPEPSLWDKVKGGVL